MIPAWARLKASDLIATWDGARVPSYWASSEGVDQFFNTHDELENYLELLRAGLGAGEELQVFDGPESSVSREAAHVVSVRPAAASPSTNQCICARCKCAFANPGSISMTFST